MKMYSEPFANQDTDASIYNSTQAALNNNNKKMREILLH